MINIKFITVGNFYKARSVKVKSNTEKNYRLYADEVLNIEESEVNSVALKLDYHKTKIDIDINDKSEKYYLVYFKIRPGFLGFIDLSFKNSFSFKQVNQFEFEKENLTTELYTNNYKVISNVSNLFNLTMISLVALSVFQLFQLVFDQLPAKFSLFWVTSILSLIGLIVLSIRRKSIFTTQFYTRSVAFLVYSLIFVVYSYNASSDIKHINIMLITLSGLLLFIHYRKSRTLTAIS